jgi:hypothetical protein
MENKQDDFLAKTLYFLLFGKSKKYDDNTDEEKNKIKKIVDDFIKIHNEYCTYLRSTENIKNISQQIN